MTSIESNHDDWRELRSRVDSIANAIFLIAGGALSISIPVILSNKSEFFITEQVICLITWSWYCLLGSMLLFVLLKAYLVFEAYLLQTKTDFLNRNLGRLKALGGVIGFAGFAAFSVGLYLLVRAAVTAVNA